MATTYSAQQALQLVTVVLQAFEFNSVVKERALGTPAADYLNLFRICGQVILYVSVNLRAPLVGVGPVIDSIRVGLGLSGTELGVLFTLPVLCFGVFAPFAPRLLRLLPPEPLIFYSLIALTLGIALRSVLGSFGLFVGTFLLGLAISRCCTATRRRPDSRGV